LLFINIKNEILKMKNKFYFLFLIICNILFSEDKVQDFSFLIPKNNDILYCIAGSKEEDSLISMDTSNAKARVGLANFVRDRLKDILKEKFKNFNAITDILEYELSINNITEEVYNLVLENSKDEKNYFDKKSNFYYVVVVFDINILKGNFEKIIRENANFLVKLKMNRPLQEFIVKLKNIKREDFYKDNFCLVIY